MPHRPKPFFGVCKHFAAPVQDDKLTKGVLVVAGVVVLGAIMSILDITVVSVALETFQNEFDATSAQVAWTMTGYTLALASVIPLTDWAADRFGTKRLYLLAVGLFTAGSVLCAAADTLQMLVLFRVLQQLLAQAPADMADSFATVFVVGTVLVGCCLVPALFLPRKPTETPVDEAVLVGH